MFKCGEERSIVCDCTHEEKMNVLLKMVTMALPPTLPALSQNKISNKHMAGLQYYTIKNTICNQSNHFNKLGQKAGI